MQKFDTEAPHETLLVLDASMGQNALQQAKQFQKTVPIDGVILTKLDGTAKGGIIFAVTQLLQLPIRFIGVGESIMTSSLFVQQTLWMLYFMTQTIIEFKHVTKRYQLGQGEETALNRVSFTLEEEK